MSQQHPIRRWLVSIVALVTLPVSTVDANDDRPAAHPLDPALKIARDRLQGINDNVRDYTATIVKRERIGGKLTDYQYMAAKIRHSQKEEGRPSRPFSVYLKYLKPRNVKGREVIWVEGRNKNKIIAHEAGLAGLIAVHLKPDSMLAMRNNRYAINKIGFKNLVAELIVKGEQDRRNGDCEVKFYEDAKVDKRTCLMIEVLHPEKKDVFEYHRAQIFIDRDLKIPIRYAAWSWPQQPGGSPVLEEEYTYRDVKLNVGLTDRDFDPENSAYNYP